VNRSVLGRVFTVLFVFYTLAFGAFLVYSIVSFTPEKVLPAFQWEYSLRRAFLLFMDYLIPVHVSAVVIAFSLAGAGRAQARSEPGRSFGRAASSTLVAFIALAIVYTVLFIGITPLSRQSLADFEYQSRLAREFLALANRDKQNGNYASALGYADLYLTIDMSNQAVLAMDQDLQARAAKQKAVEVQKPAPEQPSPEGLDATSLLDKARYYYEKEDYFSAHYYATQAYSLEPGRTDALHLAALAWDKITAFTPPQKEAQSAELYKKKKDAYTTLVSGDPITAYYSFLALSAQYPKDADIAEYLDTSRARVQQTTFFVDEAARVVPLPGTQNILFINKEEKGITEAVSIGKLVETLEATYALDIEALQYRSDGTVVYHFAAPYGRLEGGTLILRGIDRNNPKVQYMPVYTEGTRPRAELSILTLKPTVDQMRALSTDRAGTPILGLADLWRMRTALANLGLTQQGISMEIVMDVLMPFIFLTLSFLGVSFGWGFRARYLGRPPLGVFLFVPIVPFVVSLLSLLWIYGHRALLGFAVLAFGLGVALAVCAAVELAVLVISLILMAGQTSG
jgi:hypothetical protein